MTEAQKRALAHLLALCEEADRNGDGTLRTTFVRRLVNQAMGDAS